MILIETVQVREIIDQLISRFKAAYIPTEHISISQELLLIHLNSTCQVKIQNKIIQSSLEFWISLELLWKGLPRIYLGNDSLIKEWNKL